MLAVFAFSITPKIILHHFVANHKDTPFSSNFEKTAQFHKAGFNCSCDNQVVESPYTADFGPAQLILKRLFPFRPVFNTKNCSVAPLYHQALRGPPASLSA